MTRQPVFPAAQSRALAHLLPSTWCRAHLAQCRVWEGSEQSDEGRNACLCVCVTCGQEGVRGQEAVKECGCAAVSGGECEGCVMGIEYEYL